MPEVLGRTWPIPASCRPAPVPAATLPLRRAPQHLQWHRCAPWPARDRPRYAAALGRSAGANWRAHHEQLDSRALRPAGLGLGLLAGLDLRQDRFGFEPEVTAKLARLGVRFYEVGISYAGRTYVEGKKIGWRDGVKAL